MPLQALQRQVIFSTTSKVLKIFNCYWRWFQRLPLQKNLYLRKKSSQQEIGMYQDSPDYRIFIFGALEEFISRDTVSR